MMEILNGDTILSHLKKEKNGNVKVKLIGLNLIHMHGKRVADVSEILGVSPRTTYRWIKEWNANGYAGIVGNPPSPGRPPKLDRDKISLLRKAMECRLFWRVKDIRRKVRRLFDVSFSDVQMRRILRNGMGMAFLRPYFYDESKVNIYSISVKGLRDVVLRLEKEGFSQDLMGIGVLQKYVSSKEGCYLYSAIVGSDALVYSGELTDEDEVKKLLSKIQEVNSVFKVLVVALEPSVWSPLPSRGQFDVVPHFFVWYSR